jgi:hypothetical protein
MALRFFLRQLWLTFLYYFNKEFSKYVPLEMKGVKREKEMIIFKKAINQSVSTDSSPSYMVNESIITYCKPCATKKDTVFNKKMFF